IWGTAFVAQSVGMDHIGPFTFNAVRSYVGGVALIPVILFFNSRKTQEQRETERANRKTLVIGGICCGIALGVASLFQQVGIQYTTVGKAGFITALYIVIVPILGIFFHKKVGLKIWVSVVIAIVGLYLLCMTGSFTLQWGDFLILICALCFSCHILVIDHFSPKVDGVQMSCIQFFTAAVLSTVAMLFVEGVPTVQDVLLSWIPVLYCGVMSSGVAYTLQIIGQKGVNPTIASLVLSLESVIAVLAGWVILGQNMSSREILGCVLMFGAIILAQLPDKKKS
ncbi:MAG: DMT family transporter, partial [Ruminiclostridium sp.]|nr:DMT family transporter [Ruminiclostridium sp.]